MRRGWNWEVGAAQEQKSVVTSPGLASNPSSLIQCHLPFASVWVTHDPYPPNFSLAELEPRLQWKCWEVVQTLAVIKLGSGRLFKNLCHFITRASNKNIYDIFLKHYFKIISGLLIIICNQTFWMSPPSPRAVCKMFRKGVNFCFESAVICFVQFFFRKCVHFCS